MGSHGDRGNQKIPTPAFVLASKVNGTVVKVSPHPTGDTTRIYEYSTAQTCYNKRSVNLPVGTLMQGFGSRINLTNGE